jgi:hypothetical protein
MYEPVRVCLYESATPGDERVHPLIWNLQIRYPEYQYGGAALNLEHIA